MAKSTILLRQKLAETILNGTAVHTWLPNSQMYLGLWKVMPVLDDASDGQEHTGAGGYARVTVKNKWTQDASVLPIVRYSLDTEINFESNSSGWNGNNTKAPVVGVGFFDALTGGNCLMFAELDPLREIYPSQEMTININGMSVDFTVA